LALEEVDENGLKTFIYNKFTPSSHKDNKGVKYRSFPFQKALKKRFHKNKKS